MLSRGSLLAGVLCQVRDRRSSKQFAELVRSRSHSVPAIRQDFMEDGSEQPNLNSFQRFLFCLILLTNRIDPQFHNCILIDFGKSRSFRQ